MILEEISIRSLTTIVGLSFYVYLYKKGISFLRTVRRNWAYVSTKEELDETKRTFMERDYVCFGYTFDYTGMFQKLIKG